MDGGTERSWEGVIRGNRLDYLMNCMYDVLVMNKFYLMSVPIVYRGVDCLIKRREQN